MSDGYRHVEQFDRLLSDEVDDVLRAEIEVVVLDRLDHDVRDGGHSLRPVVAQEAVALTKLARVGVLESEVLRVELLHDGFIRGVELLELRLHYTRLGFVLDRLRHLPDQLIEGVQDLRPQGRAFAAALRRR